jgi:hypothetical protein
LPSDADSIPAYGESHTEFAITCPVTRRRDSYNSLRSHIERQKTTHDSNEAQRATDEQGERVVAFHARLDTSVRKERHRKNLLS